MAAETSLHAPPHAAGLTRLRFAFIAWVVLYHLDLGLGVTRQFGLDWPWVSRGYLGVDGFFLLSGFALFLGYGNRPPLNWPSYRAFLLRRIAKIFPLHLLALAALVLLVGAAMAAGISIRQPERFSLRDLWLQALLVNAWETTRVFAWNYPSWALSAEWAGYLAFPPLLWLVLWMPRAALPPALALLLAGIALQASWQYGSMNQALHLGLLRFGLEFGLGLCLARLLHKGSGAGGLPPWPLLAGGLALLLAGLWLRQDAIAVAALAAIIAGAWRLASPAAPPRDLVHRLGQASFGVYLCFVFIEAVLAGLQRILVAGPWLALLLLVLGFLANLLAGWLAWRLVEEPAHRWLLHRAR